MPDVSFNAYIDDICSTGFMSSFRLGSLQRRCVISWLLNTFGLKSAKIEASIQITLADHISC